MPMHREGGWATREVKDIRENRDARNNVSGKWQAYETKISRNIDKIRGRFCIALQMNKVKEISDFQEYQSKFWDQ